MDYLELIKYVAVPVFTFIIIPMAVWLYRRLETKVDDNEKKLIALEIKHTTLDERVTNMRADLKEIKDMLRQLLNKV